MIGIDQQLAGLTATTQVAKAVEVEQTKQKESVSGDILEGVATGADVVGLAIDGCSAVVKAVQPSHLTGGKDAIASFTTGGGDGVANAFRTVADCTPPADAVADDAGIIADVASVAGDVVSGAADVVGGIIGGILDGL
jgi:hypothetical protein